MHHLFVLRCIGDHAGDWRMQLTDGSVATRQAPGVKALRAAARLFAVALACTGVGIAHAGDTDANSAASLLAKYGALQDQLSHNQFQRPLVMDSSENSGAATADIYALINYPFATVDAALSDPAHWCDILILHLNIKYCRASAAGQGSAVKVNIGRKFDQPLDESYPVEFAYHVAARTPDYLQVRLNADEGPLSTRDYRIMLEAVHLDGGQSFIHLSYSYAYGLVGRLAMQVYLSTIGRGKVGFTVVGQQSGGRPLYIGGTRGAVERNTMRYYLAIEAYLGALFAPPQAQLEQRLRDWFAAAERYSLQLHEMEQGEYLAMKRKEYLRQQAGLPAPTRLPPGE
jgi:hypothetical protein